MTQESFLIELQSKEIEAGLFDFKIDGITIYKLIRRTLIENELRAMGLNVMERRQGIVNRKESIKNTLLSTWQIFRLRLSRHSASTVFMAYPRVDKVGDYFMDKFTDPLVSLCFDNKKDVVILDQGRGGYHAKPRLHQKNCIQTEWYVVYARFLSKLFYKRFYRLNKEVLDRFYDSLLNVFGPNHNKKELFVELYSAIEIVNCYEKLFRHLEVKRVLGPARDFLRRGVIAAHRIGANAFELQHGITYGETLMYGGCQPKDSTPDYFFAFGENDPKDVYGIGVDRVVNIGWAFGEYVSKIEGFVRYNEQDVLVISDPTITDAIIDAVVFLAEANPSSHFYVRPHPHEMISGSQRSRLESLPNAHWQDNRINIALVMQGFTHVIGENSTVLYESLAAGKKTAKLYFDGLRPRYLKEEDKECFWEVSDQESFSRFLNENSASKKTKSIYSPFNKELFLEITGIKNNN